MIGVRSSANIPLAGRGTAFSRTSLPVLSEAERAGFPLTEVSDCDESAPLPTQFRKIRALRNHPPAEAGTDQERSSFHKISTMVSGGGAPRERVGLGGISGFCSHLHRHRCARRNSRPKPSVSIFAGRSSVRMSL